VGVALTATEWDAAFRNFERSAFRLELQPRYYEADEEPEVQAFLSGEPVPPESPEWQEWFDLVRSHVAAGRQIERVRVHEDPPTPYQQWERWAGRWNVAAGEDIRYITRERAHEVGLLPAAGTEDWWLFDSTRLAVMRFSSDGRRVDEELITDPQRVQQACVWRRLAIQHSVPDSMG
jgi:Family of unknown function (DUF6879)